MTALSLTKNDIKSDKGTLVKEYMDGATKIKIYDKYISVSEKEKKDRDYSIGGTVLKLLNEIKSTDEKYYLKIMSELDAN